MALPKPTLKQLHQRITADFENRLSDVNGLLPKAVARLLAVVFSGAVYLLYGYAEGLVFRLLPFAPDSETIEEWAAEYGMYLRTAEAAQFILNATGTNGSIISVGSIYQSADGYQYSVDADVTISGGIASPAVTAVEVGTASNLNLGDAVELVEPIAGVDAEATVATIVNVGFDDETPAELHARYKEYIAETSTGGNDADYKRWTKEITGVDRVWTFRHWAGLGTVGVMFTVQGSGSNILPTQAKIDEVHGHLVTLCPLDYDDIIVFAPTLNALDPVISLNPDTAAIRAAVEVELEGYLVRVGGPSTSLPISQIDEAISIAQGEVSHQLLSPVSPFNTGATSVPVLGTVTWQ